MVAAAVRRGGAGSRRGTWDAVMSLPPLEGFEGLDYQMAEVGAPLGASFGDPHSPSQVKC